MGATSKRVLVVDDDPDLRDLLEVELQGHGFFVATMHSAEDALAALANAAYDAVLTDLNLPGMPGLQFCEQVIANQPGLPVVVMTAYASLENTIAALRIGVDDYVTKPVRGEALAMRLRRVIDSRELRDEVKRLRHMVADSQRFHDLMGQSVAMQSVYTLLGRIADSEASVLITGESGTGKEVTARSIHASSRRKDGPFVPVNLSAVPGQLLESELFGHAKGAFTSAHGERAGLFQRANGGTIFLDEIGDMPLELQPKLLRALQERKVRPVGSDDEVAIDVRVIAATNRDLDTAVEEERFREDLYFRINVVHVELPPLRVRGRDILMLGQHFLDHFALQAEKPIVEFSQPAAERLLSYQWPGNVRELRNCVERAVALAQHREIVLDDLSTKIRNYSRSHVLVASDDPQELAPMEQVERRYIIRVMEAVNANKTMAAKVLGFDRKTLYRKLERHGIDIKPREQDS